MVINKEFVFVRIECLFIYLHDLVSRGYRHYPHDEFSFVQQTFAWLPKVYGVGIYSTLRDCDNHVYNIWYYWIRFIQCHKQYLIIKNINNYIEI